MQHYHHCIALTMHCEGNAAYIPFALAADSETYCVKTAAVAHVSDSCHKPAW